MCEEVDSRDPVILDLGGREGRVESDFVPCLWRFWRKKAVPSGDRAQLGENRIVPWGHAIVALRKEGSQKSRKGPGFFCSVLFYF